MEWSSGLKNPNQQIIHEKCKNVKIYQRVINIRVFNVSLKTLQTLMLVANMVANILSNRSAKSGIPITICNKSAKSNVNVISKMWMSNCPHTWTPCLCPYTACLIMFNNFRDNKWCPTYIAEVLRQKVEIGNWLMLKMLFL